MSTHWPGSFIFDDPILPDAILAYMRGKLPVLARHRLYFDHGTAVLDTHYAPWQMRVDAIMTSKGYSDANWTSRVHAGAEHSEQAWSARLHETLAFFVCGKSVCAETRTILCIPPRAYRRASAC